MISALEALERLRAGNRRFAADSPDRRAAPRASRRAELSAGQAPFAIVLGCSDSRVPAELVFDQGLGDLFVVRVAGNVAAPSQIGSVEFAAEVFGTRLVLVLGHSQCGAVAATLEEIERPSGNVSPNLGSIVDRIRPAVEGLLEAEPDQDPVVLRARAVRANIRAAVSRMRHESPVLEHLIRNEGLLVLGAEYALETGLVEFIDGMP